MWTWHDGADGWGVLWMFLMMSVLWIPLIAVLLWGLRGFPGPAGPRESPASSLRAETPDAREVARQAYARGDMDRERYLQVIEDLDRTNS